MSATPSTLTVFIPCKLVNPLNGAHGHWSKTSERRRAQRDLVSLYVWRALRSGGWTFAGLPSKPKRVTFTCHVARLFDDDAIPAICKSFRDGLVDVGAISGDGPKDGHVFTYTQRVAKPTGVEIMVELA